VTSGNTDKQSNPTKVAFVTRLRQRTTATQHRTSLSPEQSISLTFFGELPLTSESTPKLRFTFRFGHTIFPHALRTVIRLKESDIE
jgi:hypothetical protein